MKDMILIKHDGLIEALPNNKEVSDSLKMDSKTHKCWDHCANASVRKCPKIADHTKKAIDEYPFITEGYQIFKKDGKLDTFMVSECNNYEKAITKEKTAEEKARLRRIKEGLKIAYFNALTVEESDIKEAELIARGELVKYNGKKLKEEDIAIIRKRIKRTDK